MDAGGQECEPCLETRFSSPLSSNAACACHDSPCRDWRRARFRQAAVPAGGLDRCAHACDILHHLTMYLKTKDWETRPLLPAGCLPHSDRIGRTMNCPETSRPIAGSQRGLASIRRASWTSPAGLTCRADAATAKHPAVHEVQEAIVERPLAQSCL